MVVDSEINPTSAETATPALTANAAGKPDVDPPRAALVSQWQDKITSARKHWKPVFDRMAKCQQIAADGALKDWLAADRYTVPIVKRHIDQMVAVLYAKNPKATAERRKRLMFRLWDGKPESIEAAVAATTPPPPVPMMGHNGGPPLVDPGGAPLTLTQPPWEPDPNALALLAEIRAAQDENLMLERTGRTFEALWEHFTTEQAAGFKTMMKTLVRRTKVNGVGWAKLCLQRELQKRPEVAAQIDDTTNQIARLEQLSREVERGDDDQSADVEALRLLLAQLQRQVEIVVREGPVFDWPYSDEVIVDPRCRHLKTLTGARWIAQEFTMTTCEIEEVYGVDVGESYTRYNPPRDGNDGVKAGAEGYARVYEIQDKAAGQFLTICEGCPDFLKEPAEPDVQIERFFTLFPLVFNETEHRRQIYPPSDVWIMRHLQFEYNRSREALREHRIAAAPNYIARKGSLGTETRRAFMNAAPHEVIEVKASPQEDIGQLVRRLDKVGIDPNLYEVEGIYRDVQRTTGSQEANLGGTSNGTATESSIAEQSRSVSLSENVDDLDEFLSALAHATGQLMLLEMSLPMVQEIAGPGAVWPNLQGRRAEIARDLVLSIKAGSSGRPNAAAKLANYERAWPALSQIPGVNPRPMVRDYCDLLDIDFDEAFIEGLPSITAMNAMAGRPMQPGTGNPATDPAAQGPQGAQNAPNPVVDEPKGQPSYPTSAHP